MTITDYPNPRFLKQWLANEPFWNTPKAADRNISPPGKQGFGHAHVARSYPDFGKRRSRAQPLDEGRHEDGADILATDDREPPGGLFGDEIDRSKGQLELK